MRSAGGVSGGFGPEPVSARAGPVQWAGAAVGPAPCAVAVAQGGDNCGPTFLGADISSHNVPVPTVAPTPFPNSYTQPPTEPYPVRRAALYKPHCYLVPFLLRFSKERPLLLPSNGVNGFRSSKRWVLANCLSFHCNGCLVTELTQSLQNEAIL